MKKTSTNQRNFDRTSELIERDQRALKRIVGMRLAAAKMTVEYN